MSHDHVPKPSALRPAEWVGEGDSRRDISRLNDRGVAVAALDVVLRVSSALKLHWDEFHQFKKAYDDSQVIILRDLSNHAQRLTALEVANARDLPPMRDEESSWHEWDEDFVKAAKELSRRVKDPKDRLDSVRARAIAQEVVENTKVVADATAMRTWKTRGRAVVWEVVKWVVIFALGIGAAKLGMR